MNKSSEIYDIAWEMCIRDSNAVIPIAYISAGFFIKQPDFRQFSTGNRIEQTNKKDLDIFQI